MLKFVIFGPEKEPRAKREKRMNAPLGSDDVGQNRVQHALGHWRTPVITPLVDHLSNPSAQDCVFEDAQKKKR